MAQRNSHRWAAGRVRFSAGANRPFIDKVMARISSKPLCRKQLFLLLSGRYAGESANLIGLLRHLSKFQPIICVVSFGACTRPQNDFESKKNHA